MQHRDRIILDKISDELSLALDMLGELNFDSFDKNEMMKRAVCMTVINIGELVKTEPAVKRSLTFSQPVFCVFLGSLSIVGVKS
ncbi:MAG: hypothetical protein IJN09_00340 [Oscillospiraceae bacterium]|nr:hypothetical protein [Oscillospiraceae bacterium]